MSANMRPFRNVRLRLSNVAQEAQSQDRMENVWETYLCRSRMYVFLPYGRGLRAHSPLSVAKPSTRNRRRINKHIKKQGYSDSKGTPSLVGKNRNAKCMLEARPCQLRRIRWPTGTG